MRGPRGADRGGRCHRVPPTLAHRGSCGGGREDGGVWRRRAVQDAYLARFVEEIRADSLRAAAYVRDQPGMVAALDTLQSFLGGGSQPPNLVATALAASSELVILEPVTWTEIQASNSLALIEDIETRSALTAYYRDRERRMLQWTRQDSRARDPFWNALYLTEIFDPRDEARDGSLADVDRFRSRPGMSDLLLLARSACGVRFAVSIVAGSRKRRTLRFAR